MSSFSSVQKYEVYSVKSFICIRINRGWRNWGSYPVLYYETNLILCILPLKTNRWFKLSILWSVHLLLRLALFPHVVLKRGSTVLVPMIEISTLLWGWAKSRTETSITCCSSIFSCAKYGEAVVNLSFATIKAIWSHQLGTYSVIWLKSHWNAFSSFTLHWWTIWDGNLAAD